VLLHDFGQDLVHRFRVGHIREVRRHLGQSGGNPNQFPLTVVPSRLRYALTFLIPGSPPGTVPPASSPGLPLPPLDSH
jgi:hypothetical protein